MLRLILEAMNKTITILLGVTTVFLAVFLYVEMDKANKAKQASQQTIETLTQDLQTANTQLADEKKTTASLTKQLGERTQALETLQTRFTTVTGELKASQQEVSRVSDELSTTRDSLAEKEQQIADLASERDDLSGQMAKLNVDLKDLESLIADTQKKLAASEGDRGFLLEELKRLQTEKAELEKQFNNLAALRDQVRKLKDELSIARRIEWIRKGILGAGNTPKGATLLMRGFKRTEPKANFDLNVELNQEGGVKVLPTPEP
ncbi:MAG: hypothetical protein ACPGL0_11125 [Limisphaerales bacterium]|jgi:chromosome segregation ATPase